MIEPAINCQRPKMRKNGELFEEQSKTIAWMFAQESSLGRALVPRCQTKRLQRQAETLPFQFQGWTRDRFQRALEIAPQICARFCGDQRQCFRVGGSFQFAPSV